MHQRAPWDTAHRIAYSWPLSQGTQSASLLSDVPFSGEKMRLVCVTFPGLVGLLTDLNLREEATPCDGDLQGLADLPELCKEKKKTASCPL